MDLTVRYANFDELPRVNELRRTVSELHAEGRPDIFRPGFCEELQQHIYTLFDAPQYEVIGLDYRSQTPWDAKIEFRTFLPKRKSNTSTSP